MAGPRLKVENRLVDEDLEQLAMPGSDLCGWPGAAVDDALALRARAKAGEIGIHAWRDAEDQIRAAHPEPDREEVDRLSARARAALASSEPAGDTFNRLLGLLMRLAALIDSVPDRERILQELEKGSEPVDRELDERTREMIEEGRRHRAVQQRRWLRELDSGEDEPRILLSEADRARLADVGGVHLIRTAVALARSGHRPLANLPRKLLETSLTSQSGEGLDDVTAATAVAELVADQHHPLPAHLAMEDCYQAVARIGMLTWGRYSLRDAAIAFAGDELARLAAAARGNPTRRGLAERSYYWPDVDIRTIVSSVEERRRRQERRRTAAGQPTARASRRKADQTLIRQLQRFDEQSRAAGVTLLTAGADPRYRIPLRPGGRPVPGSLSPAHPEPWLRAWWAHHATHEPELALTCCDADYVRDQLGSAGIALAPAVADAADTRQWTRDLIDLLSTRTRLPARVVALPRRKITDPGPLPGPAAASRKHPAEYRWDDDTVEEVHEVPHVVAEAVVRTGLGAYLDQPSGLWPPTRLELARRHQPRPEGRAGDTPS
jgi:hypothetical protein